MFFAVLFVITKKYSDLNAHQWMNKKEMQYLMIYDGVLVFHDILDMDELCVKLKIVQTQKQCHTEKWMIKSYKEIVTQWLFSWMPLRDPQKNSFLTEIQDRANNWNPNFKLEVVLELKAWAFFSHFGMTSVSVLGPRDTFYK